jgi:hypothetical protein
LIGFLIATDLKITTIVEFLKDEKGKYISKSNFLKVLKAKIKDKVKGDINALSYKKKSKVRTVLLLFNVLTLNQNKSSDTRFPFYLYKKVNKEKGFDVEHVRSQTPLDIKNADKRKQWIKQILEYYTEEIGIKKLTPEISERLDTEEEEKVKQLLTFLNEKSVDEIEFQILYDSIMSAFGKEEEMEEMVVHNIGNLALLNATINRSYGNAIFPLKRKRILKDVKDGIFVPLCTQNVFMKTYSTKLSSIVKWQPQDAKDYVSVIEKTFNKFFNPKESKND